MKLQVNKLSLLEITGAWSKWVMKWEEWDESGTKTVNIYITV